ncbi:MAG: hypothetical protein IPK55_11225 [Streptococcus sp.]|nr:hypothetical protein [Streptococcus sp.]
MENKAWNSLEIRTANQQRGSFGREEDRLGLCEEDGHWGDGSSQDSHFYRANDLD